MKQGGVLLVGRRRGWRLSVVLLVALSALTAFGARARQTNQPKETKGETAAERTLYRLSLELDFEARTYAGRERLRWVNRDDKAASVVYFHLYPNLRADDERPGAPPVPDSSAPEEPRLEVTGVSAGGQSLVFMTEATASRNCTRSVAP